MDDSPLQAERHGFGAIGGVELLENVEHVHLDGSFGTTERHTDFPVAQSLGHLPEGRGRSGLLAVREILEGVEELEFVDLDSRDVVRHRIVQDIVDAYERARP